MRVLALLLLLLARAGFPQTTLPTLPAPTGRFTPGRLTVILTDPSRAEILLPAPRQPRQFTAQIWYPTLQGAGAILPLMPDLDKWKAALGDTAIRSAMDGAFNAVAAARPQVYVNGPVLRGRWPLLVFLPALGANTLSYTSLLTQLASFGYIVAAIDPTYEVFATTLDGNRIAGFQSPGWSQPPLSAIRRYEQERIAVWAADARFLLDKLNAVPNFATRIDWQRIGAMGHSAGARAAIQLCASDPRVKVCLALDGITGTIPALEKPLGHIHPPRPKASKPIPGLIDITIRTPAMNHRSFLDYALLRDEDGAAETLDVIRVYVVAYFDKILRRKMGTILDYGPHTSADIQQP